MEPSRNRALSSLHMAKSQIFLPSSETNPQNKGSRKRELTQNLSPKIVLIYRHPWVKPKPQERTRSEQVQRKWSHLLRSPINEAKYPQIMELIGYDTCMPNKVMPWLIGNVQKINPQLFKLRRNQYRRQVMQTDQYLIEPFYLKSFLHLPHKVGNVELAQLIGAFLVHRFDVAFSPLVLSIAQSFDFYVTDTPSFQADFGHFSFLKLYWLPFKGSKTHKLSHSLHCVKNQEKLYICCIFHSFTDKLTLFCTNMAREFFITNIQQWKSFKVKNIILFTTTQVQSSFYGQNLLIDDYSPFIHHQSRQKSTNQSGFNGTQIIPRLEILSSLLVEVMIIQFFIIIQFMKSLAKITQKINWFPGHMRKALRIMEESTKEVDVFLEIRDARIPYSSKNSQFDFIIKQSQKEKIIIFNKIDLCDPNKTNKIIKDYNDYGITCFGVSSTKHDDMRKIIGILKDKYRTKYKQVGLWLMAYGMPNVGKSSLINQIRNISDLQNKRTASKVTASVCTTKGTKGFKIMQKPLMFLMDSPGVSIPSLIPNQLGVKLALLGIIKERIVNKQIVLQYLVESFEKNGNDKYWKNLRLDKPQDFDDFFHQIRSKNKIFDYDAVCDRVITKFREGELGPFTLDDPNSQQMY